MDLHHTKGDKQPPRTSSDDGVVPRDRSRQKQKLKWRWHWKKKENQLQQVAQFSHDPPGHTCGLPCCIQDNEPQQALQRKSQAGCVTVPIVSQADLSDSNFIMKRKHFPSDRQVDKARLRRSDEYVDNLVLGSDDEVKDVEYAPRRIRLSQSSDGIPFAAMIDQRGEQFINKGPDWPHHRKQHTLSPAEQIRQRHITLPDCPETQHTIMFLSHQPGETSDFPEIRTTNAHTPRHQNVQASTDDSHSQLNAKVITFSENESLVYKSQSGPVSPDEGYYKSDDFQDTSHKKRLVHSKLPEVPIESTDSGLAFEQEFKQVSPEIEDDDMEDSMSVYVDHVYDVLSVVKDSANKLSKQSSCVQPGSTTDFLSPSSASDLPHPKSTVLHRSVSELTLTEIDNFTFPVEDNESCVYNGSLLSYATNDSDISLLYPTVFARHRYIMDHFDYSTSLLRREFFGSKLDQLSLSSSEKNERDGPSNEGDNVSTISITNDSDVQLHGSKHWVDLGLPNPSIKVDEYDMSGRLPSRLGVGTSTSREFDLDSNTKLKLWDLRLSTTKRDQNDYSTFPLRKFTNDDVNLGYFPSRHNLPYVADNDVAIEKITNNLMPSSVLSSNIHRDNTALYFLNQCQLSSFQSPDPTFGKPSSLDEWKQQFDTNLDSTVESQSFPTISTASSSQMPPNWIFPWREESEHEPIVFSGIYELFKSREAAQSCVGSVNGTTKRYEYTKCHENSSGVQHTGNGNSPNPTITFDPDSSIYASYTYFGGSVYGSTSSFGSFAKRSAACGSVGPGPKVTNGSATPSSGRSAGSRPSAESIFVKPGTDTNQDTETVIMTKGQIVDWRRQAEFYRDNNFITLIL